MSPRDIVTLSFIALIGMIVVGRLMYLAGYWAGVRDTNAEIAQRLDRWLRR